MLFLSIGTAACAIILSVLGLLPDWAKFALFGIAAIFALLAFLDGFLNRLVKSGSVRRHRLLLIAVPLLILGNFAARYYEHVFDVSHGHLFSFRPKSIEWLKALEQDAIITIFTKKDEEMSPSARWVKEQLESANPRIHLQVKSLNKEPVLAKKYGIQKSGQTLIEMNGAWHVEESFKERDLLPAMMYLVTKSENQLCFSVGAGERDLADDESFGLSELKAFVDKFGYRTFVVDLTEAKPEELQTHCGALFVVGASKPLFPASEENIRKLFFESPLPIFLSLGEDVSPTWKRILSEGGLDFSDSPFIDLRNVDSQIPVTDSLVSHFSANPLMSRIQGEFYFSHPHALKKNAAAKIDWQALMYAQDAQLVELESGQALQTPAVFAVAAAPKNSGRKLVLASQRVLLNRYIDFGPAQAFFLAATRWLFNEQQVAWVSDRAQDEKYLQFSPQHKHYVKWACFLVLPLLIFLSCFFIWVGRLREK